MGAAGSVDSWRLVAEREVSPVSGRQPDLHVFAGEEREGVEPSVTKYVAEFDEPAGASRTM
jgi:hypothetical protein